MFHVLGLNMAWTESNDSDQSMTEAKAAVQGKLAEYANTGNAHFLIEARKIASSMNPRERCDSLSALDEDCLRLQLQVLLALQNARDQKYDPQAPENIVTLNVAPPVDAGQGVAAGMSPEAIKDPVARKKYEEAIADNNRRNSKLRKELNLSRGVDRAVIDIWHFVRNLPEESEARRQARQIIMTTVTNKILLERLLSENSPGLTW
jgi:hypothetical protein